MAKRVKKKVVGRVVNPDEIIKTEGLGIAMYGTSEEYKDPEEYIEEVDAAYSDFRGIYTWKDSYEVIEARFSDKSGKKDQRNRAEEVGYNHDTETLVIVFRRPQKLKKGSKGEYEYKLDSSGLPMPAPICVYPNVPVDFWKDLKMTDSTGRYLRYSGIDNMAYFGPYYQMATVMQLYP